ncbi:putative carbohydrate acetylesterase [Penicillium oxalicum 114-2]|uniref:Putative carbohydrate acetylesterase n=1 Tax=Penicillium oxalicum (strain 114-2 / CGMCC 5302) TaxID=933388 RepID=S8AS83_PENO1|nr:putative carbohydrate acetylesterase [Penicillium oxalicum 114-2]
MWWIPSLLTIWSLAPATISAASISQTFSSSSKPSHKFDWPQKKGLIAFGDSYTYVQGTHGHQNFSFIGDQLHFSYDPETLLSNEIVQNQTATAEGGPNWVEYLTKCGLKPGLTSPRTCHKQLWDFAFAGADISTEYTPLHHNFTISLVNQIHQFKTFAAPVLQTFLPASKSLIAIWIGINDISDSAKYTVDFPTFYDTLTHTLFDSVEDLYHLGYRSYLFMNLPPLDRTPGNQKSAVPHPNATQVAWYNEALAKKAEQFQRQKKDVEVHVFDAHAFLSGMLNEPRRFGILNTTDFCAGYDQPDIETNFQAYGCPTPLDTYFWFNSGHMTSHTHRELARELGNWLKQ